MAAKLLPANEAEVAEAISDAVAAGRTLAVEGGGSKRGYGRPVAADGILGMSALSGITYYEPGELVMEAEAGTPLADIQAELAANGQRLAFEPGEPGPFFGCDAAATVGGTFACNVSGPRRPFAGAARDHLLGLRAVSGRGEVFAAGGRVVKNVTGYDMGKLLAGSLGTLAVLTRVTFKVLPQPAAERTVLLPATPDAGLRALSEVAGEPWEISAGAVIEQAAAARSDVRYVASAGSTLAAVRLEGDHAAVSRRCADLRERLSRFGPSEELHTSNSRAFWREMRDGALLAPAASGATVWRLTVPPAEAGSARSRLLAVGFGEVLVDWAGGLIWFSLASVSADGAPALAAAVADAAAACGGHAVLMRADDDLRRRLPVFGAPPAGLMALTRRLKQNFDPRGVLNPGRMYEGL